MTRVIVPDWIARNAEAREQTDRRELAYAAFEAELKKIDPRLSLERAKPRADKPGMIPGCLHIRRENDGIDASYIPIATDDGHPREPSVVDLILLQRRDMWKDDAVNELIAKELKRGEDKKRALDAKRSELNLEVVKSANRLASPSVAFSGQKWSAKAGGRRGRR